MSGALEVVRFRWDSPLAEEAKRIRFAVFVDEQHVSPRVEIDETDPLAHHVIARSEAGECLGTGRAFEDPDDPALWRIGRMAVLGKARGLGVGRLIMNELLAIVSNRPRARRIKLIAQTHAIPFYERFGFEAAGAEYLEEGIPHRDMFLTIREP